MMKYHFYYPGCVDIYCVDFVCPCLCEAHKDEEFCVFAYWDCDDEEKEFAVRKDLLYKLKMEIVLDENS